MAHKIRNSDCNTFLECYFSQMNIYIYVDESCSNYNWLLVN